MNVNRIIKGLEEVTGLTVSADLYLGKQKQYIVFTYQDERPVLMGDNGPVADRLDIYVRLYTPPDFNYFALKHQIRDYLEQQGFFVSIQSWVEDLDEQSNAKIRNTTFDCSYSEYRQEEN